MIQQLLVLGSFIIGCCAVPCLILGVARLFRIDL